jgi:hypothetical protein
LYVFEFYCANFKALQCFQQLQNLLSIAIEIGWNLLTPPQLTRNIPISECFQPMAVIFPWIFRRVLDFFRFLNCFYSWLLPFQLFHFPFKTTGRIISWSSITALVRSEVLLYSFKEFHFLTKLPFSTLFNRFSNCKTVLTLVMQNQNCLKKHLHWK